VSATDEEMERKSESGCRLQNAGEKDGENRECRRRG